MSQFTSERDLLAWRVVITLDWPDFFFFFMHPKNYNPLQSIRLTVKHPKQTVCISGHEKYMPLVTLIRTDSSVNGKNASRHCNKDKGKTTHLVIVLLLWRLRRFSAEESDQQTGSLLLFNTFFFLINNIFAPWPASQKHITKPKTQQTNSTNITAKIKSTIKSIIR